MSISRGDLTCGGRARPCNQASGGGTAASFSETDGDEPLRAEATDEIVSKLTRLDIRRVDTMISRYISFFGVPHAGNAEEGWWQDLSRSSLRVA